MYKESVFDIGDNSVNVKSDKPLLFAYLRVSSTSQNLARQKVAIDEYAKKTKNHINPNYVFEEKRSGKNTQRPALKRLMKTLKLFKDNPGHRAVIIEAPDRLSRNAKDMKRLINQIRAYNATVIFTCIPQFAGLPQDMRDMIDSILISVYAYNAQHERETIKVRQAQGIAVAKKNGKYHGRKPVYEKGASGYHRLQQAIHDYINKDTNKMSTVEICRKNGIKRNTFYVKLRQWRKNKQEV